MNRELKWLARNADPGQLTQYKRVYGIPYPDGTFRACYTDALRGYHAMQVFAAAQQLLNAPADGDAVIPLADHIALQNKLRAAQRILAKLTEALNDAN